ncbi:hypothetical protein chiPu_0016163 [Chiloscyllium punctatum]|uniref:Cholinephosphotransferase 1 n=1 Tax=Chiloscyllium punctatum TaxID=137246 RepID=A0A401T4T1_CHIPU|nr:hypothetical protein [Chiloscyllium punctatum]
MSPRCLGEGLFIYQSLDAIDGKQARRTNSSSPLGELFDHGCDSFSTVVVGLGTCLAVHLGTDPDLMFFCCFIGIFMFYCAHWQTYVSGSLRFGKIDVTEVQICIMLIFFLSAIGGATFWEYQDHPCLYILAFGCVASKITNKLVVAHMTKSKMKLQDTAFIGPGLLFLNQYFNSFINEYFVLWAAMVFSLCDLLVYCTAVCIQIASHLHIEVFRIPYQASEQVQNHHD